MVTLPSLSPLSVVSDRDVLLDHFYMYYVWNNWLMLSGMIPSLAVFFYQEGGQVKLCQYADDITGFLVDTSSVRRFLKIVDTFGNASEAKLNKDKCSGIWLERFARDANLHN